MSSDKPLVSVIVPYYNYGLFVQDCLLSINMQKYPYWECIVVDDGSNREAATALQHFLNLLRAAGNTKFRRIRHSENRGYNAAKNTGILAAKGEFIRLIDADDVLTPNALYDGLVNMTPDVDMVHGLAVRWYGGTDFRGVNKKTYCHAQGRMWRRSVYERFGLYYEPLRSMGDKEFIYRLGIHPDSPLPRRVKDRKIDKIVAHYRKHDGQMHKVRRTKPKYNARIKKLFKRRIKQLKREGITSENTRFPDAN